MTDKSKRTRQPNGASSIYFGKDGRWHGRVTVGVNDDGTPDRRHVARKSRKDLTKAVRELERKRDAGTVPKAGRRWRVAGWLTHWLEEIAAPSVSEYTYSGYRVDVNVHLIPGAGAHWLDKLQPEHLERLYAKMQANGSKPATAHHAHRTIRTALNEAVRRGHLAKNPVLLAKPPKLTEEETEPYSVGEVRHLLKLATARRNGARWAIALALGLRQGESLGLRWPDIDLVSGGLRVRRNLLRPKYAHGCGDPCGRKPGFCPERVRTNPLTKDTKSAAGRRPIGLPGPLAELLREHKAAQEKEREAAGELWEDGGWVFADEFGRSLNTNTDFHEWKALLKEAGLREARLHDARHTAATVLLILGVQERAVMGIMGWSSSSMAKRYQHVVDEVRMDVADRIGELIWEPSDEGEEGPEEAN
ncbi:tyrosine-type recombinase/integrase [Nocardiopsis sediminis]|uniref:Tyrosine-type recombinase/integrase n=1 Tax=Nocardiopsis sediminis TaxID=1778267 RepID=A0ABV8FPG3_9ACTN